MNVGRPFPLDPDEPENLAGAARELELKNPVVTSVDRDDLPDGGASHIARAVATLRPRESGAGGGGADSQSQGGERDLDIVAADGPHPLRLSYLPFIAKALAAASAKHPHLTANFDEAAQELVVRRAVNLGIAVATDEGLIVPVIRGAQQKSPRALAKEIGAVAAAARERPVASSRRRSSTTRRSPSWGCTGSERGRSSAKARSRSGR